MRDSGRRAREVMPAAMRAELRTVAARSCVMGGQYAGAAGGGASAGSVVPGGRVRGHRHPHPQPVARIVGQPGQVLLALVHVLDVVADQLPLLAFDLDQPAGPFVGVGEFLLLADVVADGAAGGGPGHGGDLAAIAPADLVADRSADDGADHGAGGGLARLPVFDLVATLLGGAGDHGFVDPVGAQDLGIAVGDVLFGHGDRTVTGLAIGAAVVALVLGQGRGRGEKQQQGHQTGTTHGTSPWGRRLGSWRDSSTGRLKPGLRFSLSRDAGLLDFSFHVPPLLRPMVLRLFNSLTRQPEVFKPQDPDRVTLYVCGPTVYNYVHIGNARPYVVFGL